MTSPLKVWTESDGRLLRLRLARPKANLIDAPMIAALDAALTAHLGNAGLGAILIDAEGPHFSFGASVEEHMPDQCEEMIKSIHRTMLRLIECDIPILVAVRGQCLGGGIELAMSGHLIFVAPDASIGQPEIKLGVIAPAGSTLLPELVGPTLALDLLISGRSISGAEAAARGLAKEAADPEKAALAYFEEHLKPKSASSLRLAVKAARVDLVARVKAKIPVVESLYLDELMKTRDAVEGLEAFIAKRPAKWEHR